MAESKTNNTDFLFICCRLALASRMSFDDRTQDDVIAMFDRITEKTDEIPFRPTSDGTHMCNEFNIRHEEWLVLLHKSDAEVKYCCDSLSHTRWSVTWRSPLCS